MSLKRTSSRLEYLDWVRGVAAIIMLQGHVFHALIRPDLRSSSAYVLSQFVGGMPPAIFLFLTGVTLAFLMHSKERQGLTGPQRAWAAFRRAGFLFSTAFLFRLQLWAFGLPSSPWTDLLKVDILNCMGLGIILLSPLAMFPAAERVRWAGMTGLAIAAASPLVTQWGGWAAVPAPLAAYFKPDYNFFSFFPWASFMAFGVAAGSLLRILKTEHIDRAMQWTALLGVGVIVSAYYFSNLPYSLYPKSDFWLDSPALALIKLGVILLMVPFAFVWTTYAARPGWSWVRQFGTTSLLVYWVHIELVYGRWLGFWKEGLDVAQTAVAAVGMILLMLAISVAKTHKDHWTNWLPNWRWSPAPARVSGD